MLTSTGSGRAERFGKKPIRKLPIVSGNVGRISDQSWRALVNVGRFGRNLIKKLTGKFPSLGNFILRQVILAPKPSQLASLSCQAHRRRN